MMQKYYIRNAPKGGGFVGFLRKFFGLIPMLGAFAAIYSVCDFLFLRNTALDVATLVGYGTETEFPHFASTLWDLAAAMGFGYLCFYLLYVAYRKSPLFFYWAAALLLVAYPMVMLLSFYTDAVAMASSLDAGDPSERFALFAAFADSLGFKLDAASGLFKYAAASSVFLIVFWFAPVGFLLARVSTYNKLYNLYGDEDKPVRSLPSLEYGLRRREIWRSFAGLSAFAIAHFALFFALMRGIMLEPATCPGAASMALSAEALAAMLIAAVIFFYRIWRVIPSDISKIGAPVILVLAFVPLANLFSAYKLTVGAMRGMNRSFESLGYRGSRANTVLAVSLWILNMAVLSAFCLYMFFCLPEGCVLEAPAFFHGMFAIKALMLLSLICLSFKMSLTAATLLSAFEYVKAAQPAAEANSE